MNRIKELRNKKGLTLKQLSKEIGLRDSTLSQYETGKVTPRVSISNKLANFFGVSLDYLLGNSSLTLENLIDNIAKDNEKEIINKFKMIYDSVGIEEISAFIDLINIHNFKNESDFKIINQFIRQYGRIGSKRTKKIISLMQEVKNKEEKTNN